MARQARPRVHGLVNGQPTPTSDPVVRRLLRGVAALVGLVLLAAGCADPPEVPLGADGQPDPVLAQGRDIYGSQCASCHGSDGGGGRGKKLNDGMSVERYPDIADMIEVVSRGIGSGMPRYDNKLDAQEIEAVVRYVREVL